MALRTAAARDPATEVDASGKKKLLTAQEMAEMFGVSLATFYRMVKNGPPKRKSGGASLDVRRVPSRWVGGRHYWSRLAAEQLLQGMV